LITVVVVVVVVVVERERLIMNYPSLNSVWQQRLHY